MHVNFDAELLLEFVKSQCGLTYFWLVLQYILCIKLSTPDLSVSGRVGKLKITLLKEASHWHRHVKKIKGPLRVDALSKRLKSANDFV